MSTRRPSTSLWRGAYIRPSAVLGRASRQLSCSSVATRRRHAETPLPPPRERRRERLRADRFDGLAPLPVRERERMGDVCVDSPTSLPAPPSVPLSSSAPCSPSSTTGTRVPNVTSISTAGAASSFSSTPPTVASIAAKTSSAASSSAALNVATLSSPLASERSQHFHNSSWLSAKISSSESSARC